MTFDLLNAFDDNHRFTAADIYTSTAPLVSCNTSFHDALKNFASQTLLQHRWLFYVQGSPFVTHQDIVGCVSIDTLRRTEQYQLNGFSLKGLVECEPVDIDATTPIQKVQELMQTHQVCMVYKDNDRRADALLGYIDSVTLSTLHTRHKLSQKSQAYIRRNEWIQKVERVATETGIHVYLIGGWVRDFLLGTSSKDLDFAVDGDPVELVSSLVEHYGGILHRFTGFRGVHWVVSDSLTLDFTGCRCEVYPHLAALPTVYPTHIEGDLQRRDFNINAMAIALSGFQFGLLLDPFSGLNSLRTTSISTLHSLSFLQDPTRIFRASRYCARFSYRLSATTQVQINHAIQRIEPLTMLSAQRIGIEINKIFSEHNPDQAWSLLQQWNLWVYWCPAWQNVGLHTTSQLPVQVTVETWTECWWMQLALAMSPTERSQWQSVIGTRPQGLKLWNSVPKDISKMHNSLRTVDVTQDGFEVQVGHALQNSSILHWLLLEQTHPDLLPLLHWWIETGQHRKRCTTGQDLLALNLPRGPVIGELLTIAQHTAWQGGDLSSEQEAIQAHLISHPIRQPQNTAPNSTP